MSEGRREPPVRAFPGGSLGTRDDGRPGTRGAFWPSTCFIRSSLSCSSRRMASQMACLRLFDKAQAATGQGGAYLVRNVSLRVPGRKQQQRQCYKPLDALGR